MKYEAEIKDLLIENAIHLIAEGGFEKATTKNLTYYNASDLGIKMNEVYIYRLFGSKENLYEAAFVRLDTELVNAFNMGVEMVGGFGGNSAEKFNKFHALAWNFILGDEERCRCYVRYYYSVYFKGSSREAHIRMFSGMISAMTPIFKEEANVSAIMHSVFTTLFDFAIRVYNGDIADDEVNRVHIFNVLFCMLSTYLKEENNVS